MLGYTNIPASLCEYALVNQKINQLKLYIYLKLNCSGEIRYDEKSYSKWAKELEVSSKTIKNSLSWLKNNKWVTVNSKKDTLRIISYKKLANKLCLKFKSGYLFEPTHYKYFKAMCCGVVITFYMNKKRYFNRQSGNIKGFAISKNCKRNKGFFPMPNNYLAKCIGVSLATAYRYKTEAEQRNFIDTKSQTTYILNKDNKKIASDNYYAYVFANKIEGNPNTIRKTKKYLKQVEADLIRSYIVLKKKNVGF
ncbi:DNA-binding transcriptional regulator YhcF (GntR family) [Chryseobacterium ginsenosidimutans]|uniref:hypothetical protein n=1 Tax=Chryseobacterium ginsenosidimutans TaxID=687846 RepID=UPI002789E57D|nr:hypothetical protein [Chryseobacterium ginsenosidimutans]MDQ0592176.1 DNA-binding transcriptional regulator YhcF (GntR family) [Chryseobacterium ginsenosidimutans]